ERLTGLEFCRGEGQVTHCESPRLRQVRSGSAAADSPLHLARTPTATETKRRPVSNSGATTSTPIASPSHQILHAEPYPDHAFVCARICRRDGSAGSRVNTGNPVSQNYWNRMIKVHAPFDEP